MAAKKRAADSSEKKVEPRREYSLRRPSTIDPMLELYCREHGIEMTAKERKEAEKDEREDEVSGITWAVHTAVGVAAACFLTYCIAYFYGLSSTKLYEMLDEIAGNLSAIVGRHQEDEEE